jgi:hypothetical protein
VGFYDWAASIQILLDRSLDRQYPVNQTAARVPRKGGGENSNEATNKDLPDSPGIVGGLVYCFAAHEYPGILELREDPLFCLRHRDPGSAEYYNRLEPGERWKQSTKLN